MRKYKCVFLLGLLFNLSVFAEMPVIDISAIATAIDNGVTMYHQLETLKNQMTTMYQQLDAVRKDLMSIDFSSYNWKEWNTILVATNDYMNKIDNLESVINRKDMNFGSVSFSIKDLFTTDLYARLDSYIADEIGNISLQDKAEFYNKYGLSYDHYMKLHGISEELGKKACEVKATSEIIKESKIEEQKLRKSLQTAEEIKGIEGSVQGFQMQSQLINESNQTLLQISSTLEAVTDIILNESVKIGEQMDQDTYNLMMQSKANWEDSPSSFIRESYNYEKGIGPKKSSSTK